MKRVLGAVSLLALAGCANRPAVPVSAPSMPPGKCVAGTGQQLVGQPLDARRQEQARLSTGATTVRVARPGDAMTMDYREERVTVSLDEQNKVVRVVCG